MGLKTIGATLVGSGITGLIVEPFYDILGALVAGSLFAFALWLILFVNDVKEASESGIVGWVLFVITLILYPIAAIVIGLLVLALSPLIDRIIDA